MLGGGGGGGGRNLKVLVGAEVAVSVYRRVRFVGWLRAKETGCTMTPSCKSCGDYL